MTGCPHRVLRLIIDQGEDAEAKMETALADQVARYPEDAGRTVADFDWITRAMLPDPRRARERAIAGEACSRDVPCPHSL
jgi:hypothetical protein